MSVAPHQGKISAYIDEVLKHVKAKDVHDSIREELENHIAERMEEAIAAGMPEEEAAAEAIRHMGDAHAVGRQFHSAHKPRVDWGFIGFFAVWLIVGVLAMASVQAGDGKLDYVNRHLIFLGLGLIAFAAFFFMDYRKLQKIAVPLYAGSLLLMLLAMRFDTTMNGERGWLAVGGIGVNIYSFVLYLLLLAIAGIVTQRADKGWKAWGLAAVLFGIPFLWLMGVPSLLYALLFALGFFVLWWLHARNWKHNLAMLAFAAIPVVLLYHFFPARASFMFRLPAFVSAAADPEGAGYTTLQSLKAIGEAGWWGLGLGAPNPLIPSIQYEMVFTYFIYSFGWLAGAAAIVLMVFLVRRLLGMTLRIRDAFGSVVGGVICFVFAVQFAWHVLMSFGVLPIVGIGLPFISAGGGQQLIWMGMMGLLLGIYRRKDMIPAKEAV